MAHERQSAVPPGYPRGVHVLSDQAFARDSVAGAGSRRRPQRGLVRKNAQGHVELSLHTFNSTLSHFHIWSYLAQVFAHSQIHINLLRHSFGWWIVSAWLRNLLLGHHGKCRGRWSRWRPGWHTWNVGADSATGDRGVDDCDTATTDRRRWRKRPELWELNKLSRFDGAMDAWRDWAPALMSYIQTPHE